MDVMFELRDRGDKKSLWVNGQNIWDLTTKELTDNVKKAIQHAYHVGVEQHRDYMRKVMYEGPYERIGDVFK
jgi:hypothetical protein